MDRQTRSWIEAALLSKAQTLSFDRWQDVFETLLLKNIKGQSVTGKSIDIAPGRPRTLTIYHANREPDVLTVPILERSTAHEIVPAFLMHIENVLNGAAETSDEQWLYAATARANGIRDIGLMSMEPSGITNRRKLFPTGSDAAAVAVREMDEEPGHG